MDSESAISIATFSSLASCSEKALALRNFLHTRAEVLRVINRVEIAWYRSSPIAQVYVDAELKNGKDVCWWLEIYCGPVKWEVHTSVLLNDQMGQFVAREFPIRESTTFTDFLSSLERAGAEIFDLREASDLDSLDRRGTQVS